MAAPSGFMGLGPWGGISAGAAVVAVAIGGLYAAGVLGPTDDPVTVSDQAAAPSESSENTVPAGQSSATAAIGTGTETAEPSVDNAVTETASEPRDSDQIDTAEVPASVVAEAADSADPVATPPAEEDVAALVPEDAPQTDTTAPVDQTAEPSVPTVADQDDASEATALGDPSFDVVRAAPDGSTLVAGTGPAGATVTVLIDGKPSDTALIDNSGQFVMFLSLDPGPKARVLTLEARSENRVALSQEQIILAPGPVQTARAEPQPTAPAQEQDAATTEDIATAETANDPAPANAASAETAETDDATSNTATAAVETADTQPTDTATAQTEPAETATAEPTAQAPVTVLRADADGVELVSPGTDPAPQAMDRIALDTISYSDLGEVQLSGRAGRETVVRVYLDNKAITELPADPDGRWRGLIDGIEPGVYTLRLDALDEAGQVVSRLETPFKREAPAKLAAAVSEGNGQPATIDTAVVRAVTVQTGDTLWAISRDRYGEGILYVRVFEANRDQIRDPDLIYPGQVFAIPN